MKFKLTTSWNTLGDIAVREFLFRRKKVSEDSGAKMALQDGGDLRRIRLKLTRESTTSELVF